MSTLDERNIDRLFREGLSHYDVAPPDYLFDEIEGAVTQWGYKRRMLFLRRAAAVLLVLISFWSGYFLATHPLLNSGQQSIVKEGLKVSPELGTPVVAYPQSKRGPQTANNRNEGPRHVPTRVELPKAPRNPIPKHSPQVSIVHGSADARPNRKTMPLAEPSYSSVVMKKDKTKAMHPKNMAWTNKSLGAPMVFPNMAKRKKAEWTIGGNISKYFAFETGKFSSQREQEYQSVVNQEGENYPMSTISGGLKLSFKPGRRFAMYTGISYAKMNGLLQNVTMQFGTAENQAQIMGSYLPQMPIEMEGEQMQQLTALKDASEFMPSMGRVGNSPFYQFDMSLDQQYEYLEIPMGVSYTLIDQQIGISAVAGFNTGILVNQYAALYSDEAVYWQGEVKGLNKFVYNAQLGMGLDYKLVEHVSLYAQPTYRRSFSSLFQEAPKPARPNHFAIYLGLNIAL